MGKAVLLEAQKICKRFPGVQALDKVDFTLFKGEVHGLVGENGAGKSTLMNILSGVMKQDEGKLYIQQIEQDFRNPYDAALAGVGIVFQELSLIPNLSVAENIFAGRQKTHIFGLVDKKDLFARTHALLKTFGEEIDPKTPIKYLSIAKQQVVEILKAISHDPEILILDEPTSSLTRQEITRLFSIINKLKNDRISIIYISHHLQEIFQIADRATVLRDGKYIATVMIRDIRESQIVNLMVGREVTHEHMNRDKNINKKKIALEVKDLSHEKYFHDISFRIYKGEILGFAGLIGAGRSEIGRSIFGMEWKSEGKILLNDNPIDPKTPIDAIELGIAYTSENRKYDGLFLDMMLRENSIAPQMKKFSRLPFGFLDNSKIDTFVQYNIEKYGIRASSGKVSVRKLSGGNQQKVLLSMWLGIQPKVLIVDEPTKGVDVGAKSEIFSILRMLADSGVAVMVISSDLLEIMTISDRILVLRGGRIQGELHHSEFSEEKIIAYASGVPL